MRTKNFDYYGNYKERSFPHTQLITYSFNEQEQTIIGFIEEREGLIYLYEYRGKYIGIEFFISFSKQSLSYKLLKVDEVTKQ